MRELPWLPIWCRVVALLFMATVGGASCARGEELPEGPFEAVDTLDIGGETSADARACLAGLGWPPSRFSVAVEPAADEGDMLVRFPSPVRSGDEVNDLVALEWHRARSTGEQTDRPAVIVVHESGRGMTVGRILAKAFAQQGIESFLLHLPTYGQRRGAQRAEAGNILTLMRQGVADVRRAYDAVGALPGVDGRRVHLQGTSLGGIVAATAGSLDGCYDGVFLLLAGGDLYSLLKDGQRDAANVRRDLERAGIGDDELRALAAVIEPTRIAHRLDAQRVWLYSATKDTVVPPRNSDALAAAAKLTPSHHVRLNADHYSGAIYLPLLITHMSGEVHGTALAAPPGE